MKKNLFLLLALFVAAIIGGLWVRREAARSQARQIALSRQYSGGATVATASPTISFETRIPNTTICYKMIRLPDAQIDMPAAPNQPPQHVLIGSIWITQTEVTWDEFDEFFVGRNNPAPAHLQRPPRPFEPPDQGWGHSGYPAICITSQAAQAYCQWLSAVTGRKYRLPTEAEWEYACSAGEPVNQLTSAQLDPIAWFADNAADAQDPTLTTHPVNRKRPNAWGLADMLGNAAEWAIAADGTPVVKGGSFMDKAHDVHPQARQAYDPKWQRRDPNNPKSIWWLSDAPHVGFRIVMED